jgi:hypothetical protein
MIELTEQHHNAVSSEHNPIVIDPQTNAAYVLVRKEFFDPKACSTTIRK